MCAMIEIDIVTVRHHPRDRSEPAGHPNRLRIRVRGQLIYNEFGIKLVRFAIEVEVGAGKAGGDQRRAERGDT